MKKNGKRDKENSSAMKSQWGHWIRGGEKILKWDKICRISKEPVLLLCSCWTVCQIGVVVLLSLLFEVCLFKSYSHVLKISKHYSHFLSLVFGEVSVSLCFQACCHMSVTASRQAIMWLFECRLRWRRPRKGACHGEKELCEGKQCLLTLLCCGSNSHLSSFSEA